MGAKSKCMQCGTRFPEVADCPDAVVCSGCGAWRRHPDAGSRPAAFRWEAMRHYSSRRAMYLEHRFWMDAAGLLLIAGAAAGALYAADAAPAVNWQPVLDLLSRIPAIIASTAGQ